MGVDGANGERRQSWLCLPVFLAVCLSSLSTLTLAGEISTIFAGLDADTKATAEKLLALDTEHDQDPEMVSALVNTARAVGRQGDWRLSLQLLKRAYSIELARSPTSRSSAQLSPIQLAIASAAYQCQEYETAKEFAAGLLENAPTSTPPTHLAACHLLSIQSLQATGRYVEASEAIETATADDACQSIHAQLANLSLAVGADCLKAKNSSAATRAYQAYVTLRPSGENVADAELGLAWAAVFANDSAAIAAEQLLSFSQRYPQHRDMAHILRAAASCLEQAGEQEQAEVVKQRLLREYPDSDAAQTLALSIPSGKEGWPESVRRSWRMRLQDSELSMTPLSAAQLANLFQVSLQHSDDELWQATLHWLAKHDQEGHLASAVLQALFLHEPSTADHLAVDLITLADSAALLAFPQAAEAACRWAGTQERWSLLALIAEDSGPPSSTSRRSTTMDRILAESLMQMQRPQEAMKWWDHIIDHEAATDFPTLLRGAETAVAHGSIEIATKRVDAVKQAAATDHFHQSLVHLVVADLAIRRARFDEAREALTMVVRDQVSANALAPRAQWMIGETYFLQHQYMEAIDAYRKVDAIDPSGPWAPAALLQAGKAYEKLGRGRDAAVCYTALLNRFRDWPHAGLAQSRLAAIAPNAGGPVLR